MKYKELREKFKERFCRVVYDDEGRELLTFREDDILLADEVSEFIEKALKAKEEEVFDLLKNRQDRFLKKREKLMGKDNYEAGVVIGRLAELEAIKLLLTSLKGKKK